jgi:hypothetical protein
MEQESSMARSSQIASDWFHLGRVPPRAEVAGLIEAITPDSLIDHFRHHPPTRWALVTLGGDPLELRHGI